MVANAVNRVQMKVHLDGQHSYDGEITAYTFARDNSYAGSAVVRDGRVQLPFAPDQVDEHRVLFGPSLDYDTKPTPRMLNRLSAYEVRLAQRPEQNMIVIPDEVSEGWDNCVCWVTGRVSQAQRAVPNARVHICEVDRVGWVLELSAHELARLRDDMVNLLQRPKSALLAQPQPGPWNPSNRADARRHQQAVDALRSSAARAVRAVLVEYADILLPHLCLSSTWWENRCEQIGLAHTSEDGDFHFLVPHTCVGDRPDIYLWVEGSVNGTRRTLYRPPVSCNTYWNYTSGTRVALNMIERAGHTAATPEQSAQMPYLAVVEGERAADATPVVPTQPRG